MPQVNTTTTNMSSLATENITVISYWNNTNRTFVTYVNGTGFNANFPIPSGYSYYLYTTSNRTLNLNNLLSRADYNLSVGWNLFFEANSSGTNLSNINLTFGTNITVASYWNNTNKKYSTATMQPNFTYNFEQTVPYLESYWLYMRNQSFWVR